MYNPKEFKTFVRNLHKEGILVFLDWELRKDGKRLENYVFRRGPKTMKIIEPLVRREFGQCAYYKPNSKDEIEYVELHDDEFYEQLLLNILDILT